MSCTDPVIWELPIPGGGGGGCCLLGGIVYVNGQYAYTYAIWYPLYSTHLILNQCSGFMTFWCGSDSRIHASDLCIRIRILLFSS
jgi:hypothetical protein